MALVHFALFVFHIVQGSEAVTVFVRRGGDLRLSGPETLILTEEKQFHWKSNKTNIMRLSHNGDVVIYSEYKGRATFFKENNSLLLKNMSYSDSGFYTAVIVAAKETKLVEYEVKVLDPVSEVELKVDVVSDPGHTCNISVICGNTNSSFSQNGERTEVTVSGSTYQIYFENNKITCNKSNQVSWSIDQKEVNCSGSSPGSTLPSTVWIWYLVGLSSASCLIIGFVICLKRRNTNNRLDPQPTQPSPNGNFESGSPPDTTYSLVDFHTGPTTATRAENACETLYAQVDKHKDREGNKDMPLQTL